MATDIAKAARRYNAVERIEQSKEQLATILDLDMPTALKSKDTEMRRVMDLENFADVLEMVADAVG